MGCVPAGTHALWHRRATPETALLDSCVMDVIDATIDARFDQFTLDALTTAGVDAGLMAYIASFRNTFQTVGAVVPWRELLAEEFFYSQSMSPPFSADMDIPSMLLGARPRPARLKTLETSLAGLMGACAALLGSNGLYDIHTETDSQGIETRIYRLGVPAFENVALLQMGVREGAILIGLGESYFRQALQLMEGQGEVHALMDDLRFVAAFADLPPNAPGHSYLDVSAVLERAEDVTATAAGLLAKHEFNGGLLQSMLNESFQLAGHMDTVASTTRCKGRQVITETMTRFHPETARSHPMYSAGLAKPASHELFGYVPADAEAFTMRGEVDLLPVYRYSLERLQESTPYAGDVIWVFGILEAVVDMSLEHDLLPWLGNEHISITMPSRVKYPEPGETDTVVICNLEDPTAAKKALQRFESVFQATAPRLIEKLQALCKDNGLPWVPNVTLSPATGSFRSLRRLEIQLGPIPIPKITFGVLGGLLVLSTNETAVMSCMSVAAGEEDGLEMHALGKALLARDDLTSARLEPYGLRMAQTTAGIQTMGGVLNSVLRPMVEKNPGLGTFLDMTSDFLGRVTTVFASVDFLGDGLTTSERRLDGLGSYERTVLVLNADEKRATTRPGKDVASR
jgi:hypothetical protein